MTRRSFAATGIPPGVCVPDPVNGGCIAPYHDPSDLNYGGHFVWLQRHSSALGWMNVKRVFLNSSSLARFTVRLPHGRTALRLVLPLGQAGAGYVAGLSRTLFVIR